MKNVQQKRNSGVSCHHHQHAQTSKNREQSDFKNGPIARCTNAQMYIIERTFSDSKVLRESEIPSQSWPTREFWSRNSVIGERNLAREHCDHTAILRSGRTNIRECKQLSLLIVDVILHDQESDEACLPEGRCLWDHLDVLASRTDIGHLLQFKEFQTNTARGINDFKSRMRVLTAIAECLTIRMIKEQIIQRDPFQINIALARKTYHDDPRKSRQANTGMHQRENNLHKSIKDPSQNPNVKETPHRDRSSQSLVPSTPLPVARSKSKSRTRKPKSEKKDHKLDTEQAVQASKQDAQNVRIPGATIAAEIQETSTSVVGLLLFPTLSMVFFLFIRSLVAHSSSTLPGKSMYTTKPLGGSHHKVPGIFGNLFDSTALRGLHPPL